MRPWVSPASLASHHRNPARHIDARITLESAWVAALPATKTSSVVFAVQYLSDGAPIKTANYRGSASEANWANGGGEIQSMMDGVIQQALVQMAGDFRALCANPEWKSESR